VSLSVSYFRRVYGNFQITDNEALGDPSAGSTDFTQYSVTAPSTPGNGFTLPTAGQSITGLYDQNAIVVNRNVVKDASTYGAQLSHWNGVDVSVDARLRNGLYLQGGVSTGQTMTDNCAIASHAPEVMTAAGVTTPTAFCHQETPFQPLYKALASYTLPYGVRVSGTLQSLPGPNVLGTSIFNANNRTTSTTLARPFTLGQANVNLIAPNQQWGDRLNQIDLRFAKVLKVGRGNFDFDVDLYNAFNSDAVTAELGSFGPVWRLPLTVIQPRFVKFAVRYDF
jgi:hypothetical protein